jgi:hypothetical protein
VFVFISDRFFCVCVCVCVCMRPYVWFDNVNTGVSVCACVSVSVCVWVYVSVCIFESVSTCMGVIRKKVVTLAARVTPLEFGRPRPPLCSRPAT